MTDHAEGIETGGLTEPLLTSEEVAAMFCVTPVTVARWAKTGLIPSIRTPGGHRRYRESDIRARLERGGDPR